MLGAQSLTALSRPCRTGRGTTCTVQICLPNPHACCAALGCAPPQDWARNDLYGAALTLDMALALRALKPAQRQAVALRNGLADSTPRTWKEVRDG